MNQDLSEKNLRKIVYLNDFIAIKCTINRSINCDKIFNFWAILTTWNQVEILNQSNLQRIVHSLFKDNLICGRGILVHTVIRAQIKSPINNNVYAALVCIINKTCPQISMDGPNQQNIGGGG